MLMHQLGPAPRNLPRMRWIGVRASVAVWVTILGFAWSIPQSSHAHFGVGEETSFSDAEVGKVVVLPVVFRGDIPEFVRTQLTTNVFDGLARDKGIANQLEQIDVSSECAVPKCWKDFAKRFDADYLVRSDVTKTGPDHRVRIEAIDAVSGDTIATTGSYCEICGSEELAQMVADQSAALSPRVQAISNRMAYLVVDGTQNAQVWIDGLAVGKLPYKVAVKPGAHSIKIVQRGYASQSRDWIARVQVREHMNFELARESKIAERPIWGWLSLVVGLAAGAAGGTLLAIDNRPHMPSCSPADRDRDGRCPNRYNTLVGGVASTVVGAVGVGVGIGLLVHQRRQMKRLSGASAQVFLRPNGVAITGRF